MVEPHALFAHILAQTRQNVQLLIAHKQISAADGEEILSRLSVKAERRSEESSVVSLTQETQRLSMSPAPSKVEAQAIWGWSSEDPNDLAFEAGEIIEIVSETNVDWWTGRSRSGKQGVFPSNYVHKLPPRRSSPILVPEPRKLVAPLYSRVPAGQRYSAPVLRQPSPRAAPPQPYPAAPQTHYPPPNGGYYGPPAGPPPGAVTYPYAPPPPAGPPTPQGVVQQAPEGKSRFGGLGQVMAQSAASGAGFGAGAAIGSGIVNSIF